MSKLRFRVIHSSSEDEEYPADELNQHSPSTRGWQSKQFCSYPQELGFRLDGNAVHLTQIQVLSHQSKIASKVEIFVGQGNNYHTATFKRLGFLSLDNNEKTSFQARELKTVYLDFTGNFVRFLVHRCFVNNLNNFMQVGIVAVNFIGDDGSSPSPSSGALSAERKSSPRSQLPSKPSKGNSLNDLSVDLNLDKGTAAKLRLLSEAKSKAVASEDYHTAKQIKLVEGELRELGARLAQLDIAKRHAVEDEDYDRAAALKDETDALRQDIEDKIRSIQISGVTDQPEASPFRTSPKSSRKQDKGRFDAGNKVGPPNVDEMPVAGLGVYREAVRDYSGGGGGGNAGKKVVSTESHDLASPRGAKLSARDPHYEDEYEEEDQGYESGKGERQIRPKATTDYNDRDPTIEPIDKEEPSMSSFPNGQHPLEGVPNLGELPTPEELKGLPKDTSDSNGITTLLGEYRARCLFSAKYWALREAAIIKTRALLSSQFLNNPGLTASLGPLAAIIKQGVNDKIAQVFVASIGLLDDLISNVAKERLPRATAAPLMDPILGSLIEKLNDGAARVRDASQISIEALAKCTSVGCSHVATHILRALSAKQKTAWRPILGRIQILTNLVKVFGVGGSTGLDVNNILTFLKSLGAFAHSNGEVRDAAKSLCVAIHKYVGSAPLLAFLTEELRKKQLEEYTLAFKSQEEGEGDDDSHPMEQQQQQQPRVAESKFNRNVQTTAEKSYNKDDSRTATVDGNGRGKGGGGHGGGHGQVGGAGGGGGEGNEEEGGGEYTTCMFCSKSDPSWNEDGLDLHYWNECPLLSPCPACAQIVEIASLPEHLLDECEHKKEYEPCDTTGLAIKKDEMEAWKRSSNCQHPPENCMYCPLCLASVEDADDSWKQHLLYGCPKNNRSYGNR